MGIGLGIFLLVVGAIVTFAIPQDFMSGVNLDLIGWILMGAGALAVILALVMNQQRANTSHTAVVEHRETGIPPEER
ncbi:DUF6458 family protein [Oryzihumus leptocrescens]|uniref:DUF6458 domain-containing protein n=1 Tax=Oryzihumus leptocrescens TaxID=297536 RepID=A0A542Z914_9MICO|nr:DUF6458 family protein [Oryzihumus leptocrescens]TQL56811.1 hypothetical protein FB474_3572 [Oryzihumus leptocrescens]